MRGDRPIYEPIGMIRDLFTPHARGSTPLPTPHPRAQSVYPACAGIDLRARLCREAVTSLPRMRGDRPSPYQDGVTVMEFTPHARGSTLSQSVPSSRNTVYPACAGIDRA